MTTKAAKAIIMRALVERGLFGRLSARTVSFADLARDQCVFVAVKDWRGSDDDEAALRATARANGFRVTF
jgi:hypothetical protein